MSEEQKNKPRIDYIDTQGLSPKMSPEEAEKYKNSPHPAKEHKPMTVRPRRLFTPEYVKEMKILLNEVLDEREYKRKLKGPYDLHDEIEPLGPSYFDVEHFKHFVGEDEPSYQDWSQ